MGCKRSISKDRDTLFKKFSFPDQGRPEILPGNQSFPDIHHISGNDFQAFGIEFFRYPLYIFELMNAAPEFTDVRCS